MAAAATLRVVLDKDLEPFMNKRFLYLQNTLNAAILKHSKKQRHVLA
jgi:hypothetical protein